MQNYQFVQAGTNFQFGCDWNQRTLTIQVKVAHTTPDYPAASSNITPDFY